MAYKSELDRFDMERGDVLSMSRETAKAIVGFGPEIGSPILYNLVLWFSGSPGDPFPEMNDPRDNGFLAMLIEHQKKNAAKRADYLAKQREKGRASAAKAAGRKTATNNHGQPRLTTATSTSTREVEEESPEGQDFPSSTTSQPPKGGTTGVAPVHAAAGACVNAAPRGTRTATRVAYIDHDPDYGHAIEAQTFDEAELRARPVSYMLEIIEETGDQRTRNALTKAVRELGPDVFAETCWRFILQRVQTENNYAAAITKARDRAVNKYGDKGEEKLAELIGNISDNGSTNPQNDWFVEPWQKWRDFEAQLGRFLMCAINEAKLAAGIPTKRKPGKRKGGEE